MQQISRIFLMVLLLCTSRYCSAQTNYPFTGKWKRSVQRTVYMWGKDQSKQEGSFAKRVITEVRKGKIKAYFHWNMIPENVMPMDEIIEKTSDFNDTFWTSDGNGKEYQKVVAHPFQYEQIISYSVQEEWVHDPRMGVTDMHITALAPRIDIVREDGAYRGSRALFWIRWTDAQQLIKACKFKEGINSIDNLLWSDYFKDSSIVVDTASCSINKILPFVWTSSCLHNIALSEESSGDHNLQAYKKDSAFSEQLLVSALKHKLKAYSSTCGNKPVVTDARLKEMTKIDSDELQPVLDPTLKPNLRKHEIIEPAFYLDLMKYSVKEVWTFDVQKGHVQIKNTFLAPLYERRRYDGELLSVVPYLWFSYTDVKGLLNKYAEYNPVNNIEWLLWDSRFKEKSRAH